MCLDENKETIIINTSLQLAVLSQKGGLGKTTFSIHLAVATERAGHTTTFCV